ncbi:MAG: acetylglutamate kinase [Bacteroidia bacterium]
MEKLTIVKIGGKVLDDFAALNGVMDQFALIDGAKLLVHGGGKAATDIAGKLGVEAPMVNGRRITNAAMLEVAMMVYGGLMSRQMVAGLQKRGMNAVGLTGADMDVIRAVKRPVKDIDYGLAGDVSAVNTERLTWLLEAGIVPVLAPLTHDGNGQLLNTNADTIAGTVAAGMSRFFEVSLVYCFERTGVLADPNDDHSVISSITRPDFDQYVKAGTIAGGMIPKLENAFESLAAGVKAVFICQSDALGEIYSDNYPGTKIH